MVVWLLAGLGLLILLLAGDALVKGAVNMSLRLGVPALIVSLTIVAFGTSAPELLIAIQAISDHAPGLALGNVVGSNTANILLVLGVPALLATLHTSECNTRKTYNLMIMATLLFIGLAFRGVFDWTSGLILLAALAYVLIDAFRDALAHKNACKGDEEVEGADPEMRWWKIGAYLDSGDDRVTAWRRFAGGQCDDHCPDLWRNRYGNRTHIGCDRDIAAGTGNNNNGGAAPSGRCRAGQCHRFKHVQSAGDHRHCDHGWSDQG